MAHAVIPRHRKGEPSLSLSLSLEADKGGKGSRTVEVAAAGGHHFPPLDVDDAPGFRHPWHDAQIELTHQVALGRVDSQQEIGHDVTVAQS